MKMQNVGCMKNWPRYLLLALSRFIDGNKTLLVLTLDFKTICINTFVKGLSGPSGNRSVVDEIKKARDQIKNSLAAVSAFPMLCM